MPNGTSRETAEQPAPSISADFLTGSTEIGLDRIRTRLLDLTNRNKLLNYRHTTASSLRVIDVSVDAVFRRLRDNEKLAFLPVPEPDAGEKPAAKDYAEELGWNTSFDLDPANGVEQALPVLHYHEQLDTLSRKITSAAKTAIEESGANMLYLVFGFLEWYESDDSSQPHLAPLIVLPVTIERTGGKGRAVETVLEYSGEDVETNLSLVEKMRRDFGLEIPLLEEEDTPKKSWSIRRNLTLALLSFGKLLMYRDLDPRNWPPDQSIAKHALVRELFEGSKNPNIELAEEYPIDEPELVKDVPHLIRDADSSQHSALVDALRGRNLVIEGPPGTGKSQTITNLIAAALARGTTVLFVAEKLAALEVVRRRLDDAGLGMFCLEVHSHKTKKGALINDIALRFPIINAAHRAEERFSDSSLRFEFWTCGAFHEDALRKLQHAKDNIRKYGIAWKSGTEIREYAKQIKAPGIRKILDEHYFNHPLSRIPQADDEPDAIPVPFVNSLTQRPDHTSVLSN